MADPYQLQQVVLNLLVNAEQALLEGRGQGRVWIRTASTRRIPRARQIRWKCRDDGPGIPAAKSLREFSIRFSPPSRPAVGTGLGLSIVYGIVQQHGGEITFENQAGAGAKFIVELPVIAGAMGWSAAAPPQRAERAGRGRPAEFSWWRTNPPWRN